MSGSLEGTPETRPLLRHRTRWGAGKRGPGGRRALQGGAPGARGRPPSPLPPEEQRGSRASPPTHTRPNRSRSGEGGRREGGLARRRAGGRASAGHGARGTGRRARARRGPGSCPQRLPGGRRWRRGRACSGARRAYRGREVPGPPGRWRPGRGAGGDGRVARGEAGTAAAAAARGGGGDWRALALPRRPLLSVCVCSKMAARLVPRDTDAGPPPPTPPRPRLPLPPRSRTPTRPPGSPPPGRAAPRRPLPDTLTRECTPPSRARHVTGCPCNLRLGEGGVPTSPALSWPSPASSREPAWVRGETAQCRIVPGSPCGFGGETRARSDLEAVGVKGFPGGQEERLFKASLGYRGRPCLSEPMNTSCTPALRSSFQASLGARPWLKKINQRKLKVVHAIILALGR